MCFDIISLLFPDLYDAPDVASSPCHEPGDEAAWFRELERWIEHREARAPYEARIRELFAHPARERAVRQFFDAVLA
jgi:hypothetical protein